MAVDTNNIYAQIPGHLPNELLQTVLARGMFKIERIVSRGHCTPEQQWFDQDQDEWVLLLQGCARLTYADGRSVDVNPGDYVLIPAHTKHRVAWTSPGENTVWLAIHFNPE